MNKKGFAISIIMYSLVFLIISIFYILLGIYKTRYTVTSELRESIIEELNESPALYDRIEKLGKNSSVAYVQKYNNEKGIPIDTVDGTGDKEVYYFTGSNASANSNVIFGDYCWQIVRTTKTGGTKLIYNGPKTADNKCPSSNSARPTSFGIIGDSSTQYVTLTGSKLYGTSFDIVKNGNTYKFRLNDYGSYNWESQYWYITGRYVCGTSSTPTGDTDTCDVLYYVGNYKSDTQAYVAKYTIGVLDNYSIIGTSPFNVYSESLSSVGYMFNDYYDVINKYFADYLLINNFAQMTDSTAYYYGDKAVWNTSTNKYDLLVDNGSGNYVTPTSTITWENIRNNVIGKYTCSNSIDTSCSKVYYVVNATWNNYMYSVGLENNEDVNTKSINWKIGTGYTENNDGTYTLTGSSTLNFLRKDWQSLRSNSSYNNFYACSDFTSTTCSVIYHFGSTSEAYIYFESSSNDYIFGNSVTYNSSTNTYTINTSSDSTKYFKLWDLYKDLNKISNAHYTCFKNDTNNCGSNVNYIFRSDGANVFAVDLSNGAMIDNIFENTLNVSNSSSSEINKYNSAIKGVVDNWYLGNLSQLFDYIDNEVIYCNDRSVKSFGGWKSGSNITEDLKFTNSDIQNRSLVCNNVTDRFKYYSSVAKLTTPVGLLTASEIELMSRSYANNNYNYWTMTPAVFNYHYARNLSMKTSGNTTQEYVDTVNGIRPVITLKNDVDVIYGNGTYNEPYITNVVSPFSPPIINMN